MNDTEDHQDRDRVEIIGSVELPQEERAREVVAKYEDGTVRHEIEVVRNGRYVPRFAEVFDSD